MKIYRHIIYRYNINEKYVIDGTRTVESLAPVCLYHASCQKYAGCRLCLNVKVLLTLVYSLKQIEL